MKRKIYEAQALAIAMVVLVVSSIIAISVYSRVQKDKMLTLDERASAEALQVSDLILDYLTAAPIQDVLANVGTTYTENSTDSQITELLSTTFGVEANLSSLDICPISTTGNEYFLNIQPADENSYFEVRAGQVFSFPIKGESLGADPCHVSVHGVVRGNDQAGFSITKIYAKNYVGNMAMEYKDYSEEDVTNYCFASNGACNNTENFQLTDNWVKWEDDNSDALDIILNETKDGYTLDEVRIQAIGGTIGISYDSASVCASSLKLIKVQAGANCNGVYRGKEVLIPSKQWTSPIFNYTLFNGEGSL